MEDLAAQYNNVFGLEAVHWRLINTLLVLSSAILAAVAGASGLASLTSKMVAGLIALGSAALSGGAAALGASSRSTQCQTTAAADSALADDALKFIKTDAPYIDLPSVVAKWEDLCKRRDAIVANAPATKLPWRAQPEPHTIAQWAEIQRNSSPPTTAAGSRTMGRVLTAMGLRPRLGRTNQRIIDTTLRHEDHDALMVARGLE
jgi:hypothetical protein